MPDDKKKVGGPDRKRIARGEKYEVAHAARRAAVKTSVMDQVIAAVGDVRKTVEQAFASATASKPARKKPATRKAAAKKPTAKKAAARKATKKSAARKPAAKKATKKTVMKKVAAQKTAITKSAKKAVAKSGAAVKKAVKSVKRAVRKSTR